MKIPCDCSEISEIVISGDLITEYKTKKFSGKKSSNGEKIIFSSSKNYEKDAIIYEQGINEFVELERFYDRKKNSDLVLSK